MCPKDCCAKLEFVGHLARVSERNLQARGTGDITIASWCSGVSRETTRSSVKVIRTRGTGDRNAWLKIVSGRTNSYYVATLSVTRFTGSYSLFFSLRGVTRTMLTHGALHRLAIDRPPASRAFKFRSLTRAICSINRHLSGAGVRLQCCFFCVKCYAGAILAC